MTIRWRRMSSRHLSNGPPRHTRSISRKYIPNARVGIAKVHPSSPILNLKHKSQLLTRTAIRSKHISSSAKIFGTSKHEKIFNNFYDSGAAKLCPPNNSAHISSHNAVKVAESETRAKIYERATMGCKSLTQKSSWVPLPLLSEFTLLELCPCSELRLQRGEA